MSMGAFDYVFCPFCAYRGKLLEFRLSLKSGGYSRNRYRCPDCGQVMRKTTLKMKVTIEEWAEWLYVSLRTWNKVGERFYDRISWEKLLYRLSRYGFAKKFWVAWEEIKIAYKKRGMQDGEVHIENDKIDRLLDMGFEDSIKQVKLMEVRK